MVLLLAFLYVNQPQADFQLQKRTPSPAPRFLDSWVLGHRKTQWWDAGMDPQSLLHAALLQDLREHAEKQWPKPAGRSHKAAFHVDWSLFWGLRFRARIISPHPLFPPRRQPIRMGRLTPETPTVQNGEWDA